MRRPLLTWAAIMAALGVLDLWCDMQHNESTFCAQVRRTFRTDTTAGVFAFTLGLTWFWRHIVKP